jgi:hypothetical protein
MHESQSWIFLLARTVLASQGQTRNRIFLAEQLMGSTSKDGMRICGGKIDANSAENAGFEGNVGQPNRDRCIRRGRSMGLQKKSVVAAMAGARLLDERVNQWRFKPGEKGNAGEDALLQIAVGKKILT